MKCPLCIETDLVMTDRQGVEIDYCPKCRGVWLDRGELDKIIERSVSGRTAAPAANPSPNTAPGYGGYPPGHPGPDIHHGQPGYHRKKSWLGELFD
jgi:Zn-finger nucleic acid-binding protein